MSYIGEITGEYNAKHARSARVTKPLRSFYLVTFLFLRLSFVLDWVVCCGDLLIVHGPNAPLSRLQPKPRSTRPNQALLISQIKVWSGPLEWMLRITNAVDPLHDVASSLTKFQPVYTQLG